MPLALPTGQYRVENTSLAGSQFVDTNIEGVIFHDVNRRGAELSDVALTGATIRNACLGHVTIADANVTGMRIEGFLVTEHATYDAALAYAPASTAVPPA